MRKLENDSVKLKAQAVQKIKNLLLLDFHACVHCHWAGFVHELIISTSLKNKLCPNCESIQISQDPLLIQRLEAAESYIIRKLSLDETEASPSIIRFIGTAIKKYNLDEDAAFELCCRVENLVSDK